MIDTLFVRQWRRRRIFRWMYRSDKDKNAAASVPDPLPSPATIPYPLTPTLFLSQRDERLDPRSTECGHRARSQRYTSQEDHNGRESERIRRSNLEQES